MSYSPKIIQLVPNFDEDFGAPVREELELAA